MHLRRTTTPHHQARKRWEIGNAPQKGLEQHSDFLLSGLGPTIAANPLTVPARRGRWFRKHPAAKITLHTGLGTGRPKIPAIATSYHWHHLHPQTIALAPTAEPPPRHLVNTRVKIPTRTVLPCVLGTLEARYLNSRYRAPQTLFLGQRNKRQIPNHHIT